MQLHLMRSTMDAIEHPLLVLTPRPRKWLGVLAIGLVLAGGGWLMINDPDDTSRVGMGWFCLVFFSLVVVVAIVQLIPGSSRVVVTSKGIYQTAMYRRRFFAWTDIERFGVAEWTQWHGPFRQRHRLIGIRFKAGSQVRKRWRRASLLSEALVGYHGALSDNYGYKHQELADLLNQLLAAHRP
jgi:hypothetical protein